MEDTQQKEIKNILSQQQQLKQVRERISRLLEKDIYIMSGDFNIRESIKGDLVTLGFSSEHIHTTNSTSKIINKIKQNIGGIDLIVCHSKVLDSRTSYQTGFDLLKIVTDMLLKSGAIETIPFVFMEKNFEKKDLVTALKAGVSQFLVLPSNPVSLGNKLVEVFKKPEDSSVTNEIEKLIFEANKFRDLGRFDKAISIYNKALALSSENVDVMTEKANTLLELGDIDQAIKLFRKVVEIESNYPRAYQGLGVAYEHLGDVSNAKKNYLKVLELEPHNVQVCYNVGMIYQKESDYNKAKIFFSKGTEINKKFLKNYLGLAENYEAQGNHKEALNVFKKAIQLNPDQTFLHLAAGDFCLKHNLFQQAEELFSTAIGVNEDQIQLYNRLGIALRKQNKYKEAIVNYTKALKKEPDDPNLLYNQAKAYFFNGEEEAAIDILNKAFKLDSDLLSQFQKDKPFSKLIVQYPDKFKIK